MDSIKVLDSLVMVNRVKDLTVALDLARRSIRLATKTGTDDAMIKAYLVLGNALSVSRMDSAFYYYSKALALITDQPGNPVKPMLLYNIAMLNVAASNHKQAIVLLDSASQEASKFRDYRVVSNSLNALGNIYCDLGNTAIANKMYDSAFHTVKKST